MSSDTIFALATPPGRSGVAVVHISGAQALPMLCALTGRSEFTPRRAYLCNLYDSREHEEKIPSGRTLLDQVLVLYFAAPSSFTGEDVVEIQPHGSPAVLRDLMDVLASMQGARMAEPGEFTRRAFEHGKMDLTEAEAVADLIHAETQMQRAQALAQMNGQLSSLYEGWTDQLKRALAHVEADLEFPDEDMPEGILPQLLPQLTQLADAIEDHLDDNNRGERLRDGIHVAVIGAPNAGKSSLVNALAQRDVAIVSSMAGTTRDIIEVHLDVGGYPVIMADTAGLRPEQIAQSDDAQDLIESEGIKRALDRARGADLKMVVFDGTEAHVNEDSLALCDARTLVVVNKIEESNRLVLPDAVAKDAIFISVKSGQGLDTLLARMSEHLEKMIGQREAPSLTRQRHRTALEQAQSHIVAACAQNRLPELAAEDLRLAVRYIGRITGRVDVEDLLDVIFRDFCIGK